MLEKIICDKIKIEKRDLIYDIKLLKIIKINDVEEIERALKSKRFLFIINFNNDLRIDCLEIKTKSTQKFEVKLLSLSLSLLLFEKCLKAFKISRI